MSTKFPADVYKQLGWYVYTLIDPADGKPFYIGKGNGDRVFAHKSGDQTELPNSGKGSRIGDIENKGGQVIRMIIRWNLSDELATAIEAALIDFCDISAISLTNVVRGHHSNLIGTMEANELISILAASPLDEILPEDQGQIIFVNVGKTLQTVEGTTPDERCYNAAREAWLIDKKRIPNLRFVAAENQGLIVGIFEVKLGDWYQRASDNRWCFKGTPAEPKYVDRYVGKRIVKKRGDRAEFRYRI